MQNYNHEQKQDVQEQKPENILKCATTFFAAIKKKGDKLPLNDRRKFISNEIESREHEHELFYDILLNKLQQELDNIDYEITKEQELIKQNAIPKPPQGTLNIKDLFSHAESLCAGNYDIAQKVFDVINMTIAATHGSEVEKSAAASSIILEKIKAQENIHKSRKSENITSSNIFLNKKTGFKINLIRVINALFKLGFFKNDTQNQISKIEVFETIGKAVNLDLSDYDKDLSRSLSDSTKIEKHLKIFDEMKEAMTEIFNSK